MNVAVQLQIGVRVLTYFKNALQHKQNYFWATHSLFAGSARLNYFLCYHENFSNVLDVEACRLKNVECKSLWRMAMIDVFRKWKNVVRLLNKNEKIEGVKFCRFFVVLYLQIILSYFEGRIISDDHAYNR